RDLVGSPTSACDPLALGTRAINERHEISRSYRVRWLRAIGAALGGVLLLASPGHAGVLNASWTAPTVNTDGSPLTDLGLYRVYYGAGTTDPCRGSSFISVASTTTSPAFGATVTVGLTGLTTGTLYTVSVTAMDLAGNESACSATASGIAQATFAVSPTGRVNFGNVNVGGSVTQTFAVSNARSSPVSGSASVSPPFSIVSGSPFNLGGSGATATITVRFAPATAAVSSTNLSFTAGGETISRVVTG